LRVSFLQPFEENIFAGGKFFHRFISRSTSMTA
jgi:hypothetical protein